MHWTQVDMTEELYRLAYFSRSLLAADDSDDDPAITEILASARKNNPARKLTGALLCAGGCFAQVLEGPQEEVELTFEAIRQDRRHCEITLLHLKSVPERSFPDWSMAYVGPPDIAARKLASRSSDPGQEGACTKAHAGAGLVTLLQELTRNSREVTSDPVPGVRGRRRTAVILSSRVAMKAFLAAVASLPRHLLPGDFALIQHLLGLSAGKPLATPVQRHRAQRNRSLMPQHGARLVRD